MKHLLTKNNVSKIEIFISLAPSLIGWAYGICRYKPSTDLFRLSIQHGIVFGLYLCILLLNHLLYAFSLYPTLIFLSIDSFLAFIYISLESFVTYKYFKNTSVFLLKKWMYNKFIF